MKFSQIKILGFKSFAEEITVPIKSGLTGIVGPNGCGKSNVVEALRWCMGETSPKSMRGSGMEDIIFSGTQERPSRNNAEVTIFLENKEKKSPDALKDFEEIQVSRRIEKDKGSRYRINGKEVRARDVQTLFADMSTGAHSPSLVGQGRIDSLINAKPIDRRAVLEEAAGISGLHARRGEAEIRLRATEVNLKRLQDLIKQIKSQLSNLNKQAKEALKYKDIASEIRKNESILLYMKWKLAENITDDTNLELQKIEAEINKLVSENKTASDKQNQSRADIAPLREEETKISAELQKLKMDVDNLDKEEIRTKETTKDLEMRFLQIEKDLQREQLLFADTRSTLNKLIDEKNKIKTNQEESAQKERELSIKVKSMNSELEEEESTLSKLIEQHTTMIAKNNTAIGLVSDMKVKINSLKGEIENKKIQIKNLESTIKGNENAHYKLADIEEMQKSTLKNRDDRETAEQILSKCESLKSTMYDNWQNEDKKAQNLQSQLNVLNTILNKIKSSHDLPSEYRNIFVTIVDEETNKISTNLANIQIKVNEALVSYEKAKNETKDAVTNVMDIRNQSQKIEEAILKFKEHGPEKIIQLASLKETQDRLFRELEYTTKKLSEEEEKVSPKETIDSLEQDTIKKKEIINLLRKNLFAITGDYESTKKEFFKFQERLTDIEIENNDWNKRQISAKSQIDELTGRREEIKEELSNIREFPEKIINDRNKLREKIGATEYQKSEITSKLSTAENQLLEVENAFKEMNIKLANAREEKGRIEATLESNDERKKDIIYSAKEIVGCEPGALVNEIDADVLKNLPKQSEIERNIEKMKRERDELGAVNLRADLETKDLETELKKMEEEKTDLENAIKKLRKAIVDLNKEGRERLVKAFNTISSNFSEVFKKLFGGGKASLQLVDAEDPLEAGLEMMASPRGKKLQSMTLLSGGEKALTALSLIFAIFLTNPAPICILDECDAPLDESNVGRYCNLLQEITNKTGTRFIVVSHHSITMSRMDRLFGVTMAERGVSKIVAVDLQKAEKIGAIA